jgi:chitodextrinase
MTSTVVIDDSLPANFFFFSWQDPLAGANSSGWQEPRTYNDDGLTTNTVFTYNVKARDAADPPNSGVYSAAASTATLIETPVGLSFSAVTDTSLQVTAVGSFTNLDLLQSGLFFEMSPDEGLGPKNVWIADSTDTTITITDLTPDTAYTFRVRARNANAVETAWTDPAIQSTASGATCPTPGDINQDGLIDGDDMAGFVRAKLGQPAEPGENQGCADYGGTLQQDTAAFVTGLLAP